MHFRSERRRIIKEITRRELRRNLGLEIGADKLPTHRSIAQSICRAVDRWQLVPKLRVITHVRNQLAAVGLTSDDGIARVTEVFERLALLGVVEPVDVGGRAYSARSEPRWIRLSDDLGVLTGTTNFLDLPFAIENPAADPMANFVVKFNPNNLDTLAYLESQGVREWTLGDWRGEFGFVEYLLQRNDKCCTPGLVEFWETLVGAIEDDGLQLSVDAQVRTVEGCSGAYFGRGDREKPDGRWTAMSSDGVWCGVRAGYSDSHWQPVLVKVDGERRLALDLHDWNEWKWTLLARGHALGNPEHSERTGTKVSFSYPLPDDITRLLLLVADSRKSWTWSVPQDLPELWAVP